MKEEAHKNATAKATALKAKKEALKTAANSTKINTNHTSSSNKTTNIAV